MTRQKSVKAGSGRIGPGRIEVRSGASTANLPFIAGFNSDSLDYGCEQVAPNMMARSASHGWLCREHECSSLRQLSSLDGTHCPN